MGARRGGSFRALALAVLIVLAATVALTVENVFPFPLDTSKTVQSQAELELDENGHLKRNYLASIWALSECLGHVSSK